MKWRILDESASDYGGGRKEGEEGQEDTERLRLEYEAAEKNLPRAICYSKNNRWTALEEGVDKDA